MITIEEIQSRVLKGEGLTLECKAAAGDLPRSVWETYSAFANTVGGLILLGVVEHPEETDPAKHFTYEGVGAPKKIINDFWNTVNSSKVNVNILSDNHMKVFKIDGKTIVSIEVPQADWHNRPVFLNGNLYGGCFKRSHEGDYHCTKEEVHQMVRDSYADGNDGALLEGLTMDDIDIDTLRKYRYEFGLHNPNHVWNFIEDDRLFLKNLGGYRYDAEKNKEGLTVAGFMMFGKGVSISDRFANFRMDYLDMSHLVGEQRYSDRLTYDGRWENNLYNFMNIVMPKFTFDMPRPFRLEGGIRRIDDTPQTAAVREAFTNSIIHCDLFLNPGVLRIEKHDDFLCLRNPGILKLPIEQVCEGGVSCPRNPRIQNMFRMIGLGENVGSGFPKILHVWKAAGWRRPQLINNIKFNEVELRLPLPSIEDSDRRYYYRLHNSSRTSSLEDGSAVIRSGGRPRALGGKAGVVAGKTSAAAVRKRGVLGEAPRRVEYGRVPVPSSARLETQILSLIKASPTISRNAISEMVGKAPSTVQRYTDKLKSEGRIRRVGGDKGGRWEVTD